MKNLNSIKFIFVLALISFAAACHRNAPVSPPTSQAPAAESVPAPAPPTCSLTADPASLAPGQSVTLSWTSKDATDVQIEPGLDKQLAEGSATVTPQGSTTYILTATGPGGSTSCTARVTLSATSAPPPSVSEENIGGGAAALASQLQDIFFDYDAADLRPDAQEILAADAAVLKAHAGVKVTVEGHCDQRGSEEYNLGLGQRRADAARQFLANLGVDPDSLNTVSYGKDRPSCTEDEENCWAKNRRDHFVVK